MKSNSLLGTCAELEPQSLKPIHTESAKVFADRFDALKCWPKHSVVAEIGVAYGDYTMAILEEVKPRRLDAFDLFCLHTWPVSSYMGRDIKNQLNGMSHQDYFLSRFRLNNVVYAHRGDSSENLLSLGTQIFDVIYIDGNHRYAGVKKDADAALRLIKYDGIIVFNDYHYNPNDPDEIGVCHVVNAICNSTDYKIEYIALNRLTYFDVAISRR